MHATCIIESPLGQIALAAKGEALTGLWFVGQKRDRAGLGKDAAEDPTRPIFEQTRAWLDAYFAGRDPGSIPPVAPEGSAFRTAVWRLLAEIPYGEVTTYGDLARRVGEERGAKPSARAVGGALGRNPVSIILPCHRVVGADGSLTGYAGGIDRKAALLRLEGIDLDQLRLPTAETTP